MGKQAPAMPDYRGAAQKQTTANRPDISTPFGTQTWSQGPGGQWTMSMGLGTEAQSAYQDVKDKGPLDFSRLGPLDDGSQARQQAIDAAYGQATSRLDPQWARREQQLHSQLANQGLEPNSEAARAAGREFGDSRNDAYSSAMNGAIAQGTAAGDSAFRNSLMKRQQMMAEMLRERGQSLEDLKGLQGFMQMPGFSQDNSTLNANIAEGNQGLQSWQAENQANADAWDGVMKAISTIGPLIAMLSDERAKQHIERLPMDAIPGVPWATWEYRHEPGVRHLGVIAQDLQRVAPEYVSQREDGMLMVNYGFLEAHCHG